jgi:hypothetical protein
MSGFMHLVVDTNVENLNLNKYISGEGALRIHLQIQPGIIVGSTNRNSGAIYCPSLNPLKSIIRITNFGTIRGVNGTGGWGGDGGFGDGTAGTRGGAGIMLNSDITLINTSGIIQGGGGGGGGGGGNYANTGRNAGGGGGGGYGGGAGGDSDGSGSVNGFPGTTQKYGVAPGGSGGWFQGPYEPPADGGNGGNSGAAGSAGGWGVTKDGYGGAGGPAGYAINISGRTVTYVGGPGTITGAIV